MGNSRHWESDMARACTTQEDGDAAQGDTARVEEIGRQLAGRRDAGDGPEAVTAVAEALLGDPATATQAAADPAGCLAAARASFGVLERETRAAYSRYPVVRAAGFHSGEPDPRSAALFRTVTVVREAGLYLPDDLAGLLGDGDVTPAWVAREALRLAAFVEAAWGLIAALDRDNLAARDYGPALTRLARSFGALRVAGGEHHSQEDAS